MFSRRQILAVVPLLTFCATSAQGQPQGPPENAPPRRPVSGSLLGSIEEPGLRDLVYAVLERNPGLSSAAARASEAEARSRQLRGLPQPTIGVTAFVDSPQTRTGPQQFAVRLSQGLPGSGKRGLKELAALSAAVALEGDVQAQRLKLVTETRRLYLELAFLERNREITEEFRSQLLRHEEIARARYASGVGLGQGVIKLQAEITGVDKELLTIDNNRTALAARLNALRDHAPSTPLPGADLPAARHVVRGHDSLLAAALDLRPELAAADARVASAQGMVELAAKGYRPDFRVGLTYTFVDARQDALGMLMPPEGNGDDILGVQAGITIPLWRSQLAAGVLSAESGVTAAQEYRRGVVTAIEAEVGDLVQRLPLIWQQLRLVEDLLVVQASEALDSAQAGYVASTLNALDLLDAEHVLLRAEIAAARAHTDYLIAIAQLEGVVVTALQSSTTGEDEDS